MKNFMFNSNAKKKISITSALFSLLILFFALNCSFCGNFCSASLSGDNDESKPTIIDDFADDGFNHEKTTNKTETEDHNKEKDETKKNNEEEDENKSTEAQESDENNTYPSFFSRCQVW